MPILRSVLPVLVLATLSTNLHAQTVAERAATAPPAGRLPILPLPADPTRPGPPAMDEANGSTPLAQGTLLRCLEEDPAFARPDLIFVQSRQTLRVFPALTPDQWKTPQELHLPAPGPVLLLGCTDGIAILAQRSALLGIDLKTLAIAWTQSFQISPAPPAGAAHGAATRSSVTTEAESRAAALLATLRNPTFSALRLAGNLVLVASGGQLVALNAKTGQPAWIGAGGKQSNAALHGEARQIVTAGARAVAEVDGDTDTHLVAIDLANGTIQRDLALPGQTLLWYGLTARGMLLTSTSKGLAAADLSHPDAPAEVWAAPGLLPQSLGAIQLVGDRVLLLKPDAALACLDAATGKTAWPDAPAPRIADLLQSPDPSPVAVRSITTGTRVILWSPHALAAVETAPLAAGDSPIAWKLLLVPGTTPPLSDVQLSDPYIVACAAGPMQTAQRAVHLLFVRADTGGRHLDKPIKRSANPGDLEGPVIARWTLADNGVLMEVNGTVYFYHGK